MQDNKDVRNMEEFEVSAQTREKVYANTQLCTTCLEQAIHS